MGAQRFTRNKDYSDEADNNAGGRDSIDPAGLDGEMDEILAVLGGLADRADVLLRDDLKMRASFLQGHEFSTLAVQALAALIGSLTGLGWSGPWATSTLYKVSTLISINGNTYICIAEHTSGTFSTDLGVPYWEIVAEKGAGASFPAAPSADDLLYYDGATEAWGKLTAAMAPLHALLANPTFTGVVGLPDVNVAGRFNLTPLAVTQVAGGQALDFDTNFMKILNVAADYTGAVTASNITIGDLQEVHLTNTKGSDAALLWDANWRWMGYKPSSLPSGKKAVLTLRVPTGSTSFDVIASWSVEP